MSEIVFITRRAIFDMGIGLIQAANDIVCLFAVDTQSAANVSDVFPFLV